jgi:hypothetical protein
MASVRLGVGDVLAESGDLTVRRLSRASTYQRAHGVTIERALLSTGAVTEEVLTSALSQAYGLPGVPRKHLLAADRDIVACLAPKHRRSFRAVPFLLTGTRLHVAISDPRNPILESHLVNATGFDVNLHVVPDPVLEDVLDHFEKKTGGAVSPESAPLAAGENSPGETAFVTTTFPKQEMPEAVEEPEPGAPGPGEESIGRLGTALLSEALRYGATELELAFDSRGGFARTFHIGSPAITRRLSGALLAPLSTWFQHRCRREGGFVAEVSGPGEATERRRVDLLAADERGVRVRFTVLADKGSKPALNVACTHERPEGAVFCPQCGELL